jgi:hypothetical protein
MNPKESVWLLACTDIKKPTLEGFGSSNSFTLIWMQFKR